MRNAGQRQGLMQKSMGSSRFRPYRILHEDKCRNACFIITVRERERHFVVHVKKMAVQIFNSDNPCKVVADILSATTLLPVNWGGTSAICCRKMVLNIRQLVSKMSGAEPLF